MARELSALTADELKAIDRTRAVILLPIGGLEGHGPHLSMGVDAAEAMALATRLADALAAENPAWAPLIAPMLPFHVGGTVGSPSIRVRGYVLRDAVVDTCLSLYREGFRYFVTLSGNASPKQIAALEEASQFFRKQSKPWWRRVLGLPGLGVQSRPILMSGSSGALDPFEKSQTLWTHWPKEHAGKRDTSVAMAIDPTSVRLELAKLPLILPPSSAWSAWQNQRSGKQNSYWGHPAEAKPEEGQALLAEKTRSILTKFKAVVEHGREDTVFGTYYRLVPSNKTTFKVWLLSLGLIAVLCAWLALTFQAIVSEGL